LPTIAVVQNQSEMAHYGYGDMRPLLEAHGYRTVLFTGDDIGDLTTLMSRDDLDAVVLASNALNDRTIWDHLGSQQFRAALAQFLSGGRGLLSFQQLGLAMRKGPTVNLLPEPLDAVLPMVRPNDERTVDGEPRIPEGTRHVAMLYPYRVDVTALRDRSAAFPSLPGLYWHYWTQVNRADWDVLLADPGADGSERALLIATREHAPHRVVLSAMPLDWQSHEDIVTNLLLYVVEGSHNTAVLHGSDTSISSEYLLASLRANRLGHRVYDVPSQTDELLQHIRDGVHTTLVVEPETQPQPAAVQDTVRRAVESGIARTIELDRSTSERGRALRISSRRLFPERLLREIRVRIHADLQHLDYIDDSFLRHVSTLQNLHALAVAVGGSEPEDDFRNDMAGAWYIVERHDRRGSYDDVFGATVALWWLRTRYLGAEHESSRATTRWLANAIDGCPRREQALAFVTFADLRALTTAELDRVEQILTEVTAPENGHATESDTILYLRAAVVAGRTAAIARLVDRLAHGQEDSGRWVDLTTTGSAVSALLDARALLLAKTGYERVASQIETLALSAVIHILDGLDPAVLRGAGSARAYPWQGRASTSATCLRAWIQFDSLIDIPVREVVDTLRRDEGAAAEAASLRSVLAVLQEIKSEAVDLRDRLNESRRELARANRMRTRARLITIGVAVLVYLLFALFIGLASIPGVGGLATALRRGIVDAWAVHAGVVAALAAILTVPWERWFSRQGQGQGQ
jgi:hypothetical protein